MSAYGKPQPSQIHGYEVSRAYTEPNFAYTAPVYNAQLTLPPTTSAPAYQNAAQLTSLAYPPEQVRTAYDEQAASYLDVGSAPLPEVKSFQPVSGRWNTNIYVYISSLYEVITTNTPVFYLMFGQRKVAASIQKLNRPGDVYSYQLAAVAPEFSTTSWSSSSVPIFMWIEGGDGSVVGKVDVGDFTYIDVGSRDGSSVPLDGSRKRKVSEDSTDLMTSLAKRNPHQQLRPKQEYGAFQYPANDSSNSYAPYTQSTNSYHSLTGPYLRPAASLEGQAPPRQQYGYNTYSSAATASSPTLKTPSPQTQTWNTYQSVGSAMSRNHGVPSNAGMTRHSLASIPSPALPVNPPLIRTSTLQQTPSPATTPHGGQPNQHFNAYALYSHKAQLEIDGDLDSMAMNWTTEEFEAKRRLVRFKRSQSGSTITTTFQPVGSDEKTPTGVCVSCIFWEEKGECFITSVDTLMLLEKLVDVRFTVEEKNRIRRNLEGLRPLTVSKGKADSEEFFKVIMAFPLPKPRNIEKDVKVFHWKDLSSALKKIIGKYSASPASTIPQGPALLTPISTTGYASEVCSTGLAPYQADHHRTSPPHSIASSVTSYNRIPTREDLSPHLHQPISHGGGPPEPPSHWQGTQHMQHYGVQNPRSGWGMGGYLDGQNSAPPPTVASTQYEQVTRDDRGYQKSNPGGQRMPRS